MSAVLTRDEPVPPAPSIATVHPAKGWYVVFGGLVVVSLLAGLGIWFMGKRSVENTIASYARFVGPNTADLRFKRAGQYLVYYEYDSTIDGERIEAPPTPPPGIALDLKDEAGESLELRRVGREFRYDTGEHRAVSLRRVTIPREGLYQLSALAPGLDQFVIAVGRGSTPTTDASTRTAVLVGLIGALLGVIGLVTVGILRSRSRAGLNVSVPVPWSPEPALTAEPMPTPPPPPPVTGPVPTIPPPPARAGDSGPVPVTPAPDAPTATGPTPTPPPPPPAPPGPGSAPGRAGPGGWAPPAAGTATEPGGTSPVPPPGALPPPPA